MRETILNRSAEAGFSVLEAVLSAAILAFSALAVASGELDSFLMNQRSDAMLKGVSAAENIVAMMRRNPTNIDTYNNTMSASTSAGAGAASSTSMAKFDFEQWQSSVNAIESTRSIKTAEYIPPDILPCVQNGAELRSCGTINVGSGLTGNARSVTVRVGWPSRPTGITIMTTIAP
jgi:Tfp pilus assembly protein PilV